MTTSRSFSGTSGWITVAFLTIAYLFSFIDRWILGLLIEPIKADLGLTDTQIGLLLGPAFAIFYATMGLPLGWLADRRNRVRIVAVGIGLWSLATAASGLAKSFIHLFIARMSIGIGEATLSPCAMSIISDSFPREKRSRPIAVYTTALSLGAGLASLLGAVVLTWAKTGGDIIFPLLGALAPWQATFIVVGLPGLLLALVFMFLREPPRAQSTSVLTENNIWDMIRYVSLRWRLYGSFVSAFSFMVLVAYSHGWCAVLFSRTWGWDPAYYATINGFIMILFGPAAVLSAGWISDRWLEAGKGDAPLRIALMGVLTIVVTGVLAPLMPNPYVSIGVFAINTMGIGVTSAMGVNALLSISPGHIRAQIVAFYYMCISLAGLLLGPTSVAFFTDNVFGEENIRYSLALVPLIYGLPILLASRAILRNYSLGMEEHRELV